MSSPCCAPARPRNCCSPRRTGAASSPRRRARSPRPARASRSSTCAPARRLKVVRPLAPGDDYVAVIGENRKLVVYPLGRAARNGPRPGRPAAALPRRRPLRRDRLHLRRGPVLADGRRRRPHPHRERHESRGAPRAAPPAGCRPTASPATTASADRFSAKRQMVTAFAGRISQRCVNPVSLSPPSCRLQRRAGGRKPPAIGGALRRTTACRPSLRRNSSMSSRPSASAISTRCRSPRRSSPSASDSPFIECANDQFRFLAEWDERLGERRIAEVPMLRSGPIGTRLAAFLKADDPAFQFDTADGPQHRRPPFHRPLRPPHRPARPARALPDLADRQDRAGRDRDAACAPRCCATA